MSENLATLLSNPNFLVVAGVLTGIALLVIIWFSSDRHFKADARLFDLRRNLQDEMRVRENLMGRLYDLEERVARLEDPLGKRKRGNGIYAWDRREAIPGLTEVENTAYQYVVYGGLKTESPLYKLGDDGELRKDDAHE